MSQDIQSKDIEGSSNMLVPFITKDKMRELVDNISLLAHYLITFLEEKDSDLFYKEFDSKLFGQTIVGEKEIRMDEIMKHKVISADLFVFELVPYLKEQPDSYLSYLKQELLAEPTELLRDVLQYDDIEIKIFHYQNSDLLHDTYLVLKAALRLFDNLDTLIKSDDDALDEYLEYRLSFLGINDDKDKELNITHNAFTWYGTPAELACLMDTLNEKGYIDAPLRANGERNNESFNKIIGSHFRLADGSEKSVLNNLKDSRITPDNQYKIAIDKLPKKR
jgi:hypothetical protein